MDDVITIDPIEYLMAEALKVLDEKRPDFRRQSREYRAEILEMFKRTTLRRSMHPHGYYVWSMTVHRVTLSFPTSRFCKPNIHYNPLHDTASQA